MVRSRSVLDPGAVRACIPALDQRINGHPLTYLDSASTALKPTSVIDAVRQVYAVDCANIHRGVHTLSQRATERFERVRDRVAEFLGQVSRDEVIFVRGATEGLNLVAQAYGRQALGPGDEVLVTQLEHHSNIVPWQMLAEARGAKLEVLPIDDRGEIGLERLPELLKPTTKIVAVSHVSNSLGTETDVRRIADLAHEVGAVVVVDGAQAAPHVPISVGHLAADFYVFSGHKVYGPTGAGILWGRRALLERMPPWQGGGEMIASVSFEEGTAYAGLPHRLEAGTPDIAAVVGLGAALDWMGELGRQDVFRHEAALLAAATEALDGLGGVRILGRAPRKGPVLSFIVEGVHPHDAGTVLDTLGIAVRTGHHCAEPVMERFGVAGTVRASFAAYNTLEEVERLVAGVEQVQRLFGQRRGASSRGHGTARNGR